MITEQSLPFFDTFKDNFCQQVLDNYRNLRTVVMDFGMLFFDEQKDVLINKITTFRLNPNIETFKVIRAQLNGHDLEALTKRNFLENTQALCLSMTQIYDDHLAPLVMAEVLKNLRSLDLSANHLTEQGMKVLTNCEYFYNLRSLNVSSNKIKNRGLIFISKTKAFPTLEHLDVSKTGVTETGIESLT